MEDIVKEIIPDYTPVEEINIKDDKWYQIGESPVRRLINMKKAAH